MPKPNQRMESGEGDEEALFRSSYPYAVYFVSSPSTLSHANSADGLPPIHNNIESGFHTPLPRASQDACTLSRCSSSRGSNNSFCHDKKMVAAYDLRTAGKNGVTHDSIHRINGFNYYEDEDDAEEEEEEEEEEYYYNWRSSRGGGWWWRYFSFRESSSCGWMCLQIGWRAVLSFLVALLVFYISTKPPSPKITVKVAGIKQFGLGEGADSSGVTTKILSCNCSIDLLVDNKSKLFGLHIHPPLMTMSFTNLLFARSQGSKLYAESGNLSTFKLFIGTTNKPMYGAGRNMEDMLKTEKGLPLVIHMRFRSSFRVVGRLIKPKFHHQASCLVVLGSAYDKKHRTQAYNSTCTVTS